MVQFSNTNYYNAMDRFGKPDDFIEPLTPSEESADEVLNLGLKELGTTTNPMGNAIASVKERIMQGTGRLEFEFIGQGKGNSQSPTPESYGSVERQDMKELLTINDIKSSVHASVHGNSLAGFGQNGFSGQQREAAIKEINRAINFAGDVTDGGAIVFHLSEWQRPLTHAGEIATNRKEGQWMFKGYDEEDEDSQMLVVDKRTGQFITGVSKNQEVFEPEYRTVGKYAADKVGSVDPKTGKTIRADDFVDIDGNVIPKNSSEKQLFNRVPEWDDSNTNFKVKKMEWKDFVRMADEWNTENPKELRTPEYYFARTRIENSVLQAKGTSLYHAMKYRDLQKQYDRVKDALDLAKNIEAETPEDEQWSLRKRLESQGAFGEYVMPENKNPTEYFEEQLRDINDHMRHIHEASSAADAQAVERIEQIKNLESAEQYGLKKTAETIARVGMSAMETTKRKGLADPLYAAPENWNQNVYGSHPDEMRRIVKESRKTMAKMLESQGYASGEEAQKIASQHIKATFDVGHLNMWRQHFDPVDKDGNQLYHSVEERHKAFDKWLLKEGESLVKEGIVGHIHLSDNFGWDDEHISPGQGNVPMKEFLKRMEKAGMKEMIVEPGSYNQHTASFDAMALVGSPIYGVGRGSPTAPRFNQIQHRHFGYNAPPFFTGGAYVPSNDWRPWTEVPLE